MSTPVIQNILAIPGRFRQQLGTLRNRVVQADKPKSPTQVLQTSLRAHRPVWITAGGATYTSAVAVFLTLRYMRHLR